MSQQYLQELGVSSDEIDDIVATCMEREIHAKLTGAGGGGSVICFPKEPDWNKQEVFSVLEGKGYQVFDGIEEGLEGVTISFN